MVETKSEHFSLRWDNFHSNLSTSFHTLLQGEELVDVTIAAEGRFVQAHKIVLSVCSPYFKSLFKVNPCKHPIVILKDVGHKELVDILEFMYRGEVNVGQEDLTEFLKTAELLQVKGLTGDDTPGESGEQETITKHTPAEPRPVPPSPKVKTPQKSPSKVVSPRPLTPQPTIKTETVCNQAAAQPPPQKRMRQEPPQYNPPPRPPSVPHVTMPLTPTPSRNPVSSTSDSSSDLHFVEMSNPKSEPVEIDSDIEEVDATFDDGTDFSEFFGGQSSQSFQDFPAMGLPDGQSGALQDMGMPQEGEQESVLEFVRSRQGRPLLVHKENLFSIERSHGSRVFWKCTKWLIAKCRARIVTLGNTKMVKCDVHTHESQARLIEEKRIQEVFLSQRKIMM